MKKNLILATSLVAVLALNGCGGGGSSSSSSASKKYSVIVPLSQNPQEYRCEVTEDYIDNPNEAEVLYLLSSVEECEEKGKNFLVEFARNDTPKYSTQEQLDGLAYINDIRSHIGLPIFHHDSDLEDANRNHQLYLKDIYSKYGVNTWHDEDNQAYPSQYYTGDDATSRIKYVTDRFYRASDVITYGTPDTTRESLQSLMTAIYHRMALLDNRTHKIGVGYKDGIATAHLMGWTDSEGFFVWRLSRLTAPIINYPYDGQTNVQTTFHLHSEHPDPMPNATHDMGNPISLNFNSVSFSELISFKLFEDNTNTEVDGSILDKDNDPTAQTSVVSVFGSDDFAFFPNYPLKKNTTYRVEVEYLTREATTAFYSWKFSTTP